VALLEKAARQGHVDAIAALGDIHHERKEPEQAVVWFTMAAEAGSPQAMYNLGVGLDSGEGVAAPDSKAAAGWFKRAADAGVGEAASCLCRKYTIGSGRAFHIMTATSSSIFQTLDAWVE
jgi:TPR repeat protein